VVATTHKNDRVGTSLVLVLLVLLVSELVSELALDAAAASSKQQAASSKQQAASSKQQAASSKQMRYVRLRIFHKKITQTR
jgi:hypothetical protein